eukprot:4748399-Ditylum_brightwellii.AAC.1
MMWNNKPHKFHKTHPLNHTPPTTNNVFPDENSTRKSIAIISWPGHWDCSGGCGGWGRVVGLLMVAGLRGFGKHVGSHATA